MSLTILFAEDHPTVADAVKDTLEAEGWQVVTCMDGAAALNRLASGVRYDLLLTDKHLPDVDGLELVRYARGLRHLAGMPVVMLSAVDCGSEAYKAGVDVFLRKPEGMNELIGTVARLLDRGG
jgi:DNA-binding response OmpR family regulator